jgi:hypothetical protein
VRSLAAALVLSLAARAGAAVPSPDEFLGVTVGADRTLADWTQIAAYFHALDAASPRVVVREVGRTTDDRPFLLVAITSEANMARLDAIRADNLRLADPRTLAEGEADRLIDRGRAIVAMNYGIHSTEVGTTQAAMLVAHRLATAEDEEARAIRDQTVVLMLPSHNPDGTQTVTEWYRRSLGTAWEGAAPPFLYQRYTGHDNNRDWYMFTQQESRLTAAHLHDAWRPQVVHDVHEMGSRGARMSVPPYLDPWEPNVDPALVAAANGIGAEVAARLTAAGRPGIAIHAIYDAWSPSRAYPHTHGGVRVLSETASAKMATPIVVQPTDLEAGLGYDARRRSWNFPLPWPGGAWRLADVVDYQVAASLAVAAHAAAHREQWLRTMHGAAVRAVRRETPFAFVFPAAQADPLAAATLLRVLRTGAVEVSRARTAFDAAGLRFEAGSHVVLLQQPFGAFAKQLLERQRYPDLRAVESAPPQRPYDATAHTLPLLMGVDVHEIGSRFDADLEPVNLPAPPRGRVERGGGPYLAFGHRTGDLVALGRLLDAGIEVRWATAPFLDRRRPFPAGTLVAPASARPRLAALAAELGLIVRPLSRLPPSLLLRAPRVGVYQSWLAPMDEGWTRYVFERQTPIAYRTLHDADLRAGRLRETLDAIVLPDQEARQIVAGHAPGSMPPEYVGGIGKEGVAALRAFVEAGGALVALNSATELPIAEFGLAVTDALSPPGSSGSGFFSPGAILAVQADPAHPLAHGMPRDAAIWFETSPAFDVKAGRAVLRYTSADPLLSGWLLGGERLSGRAALVDVPLGKGRVVLFGFRPQYRAQSWATYVPLLNALYLSAATPAP